MLRRVLLISAAMLLALCGATLAQAARSRHFSASSQLAVISQSANYPAPGSSIVSAGAERNTLAGGGAVIQSETITGHPTATTYTFTGTGTDFFSHGTLKSTLKGTATVNPDGSLTVAGSGRYTGGTDVYKHAKGRYTFTGSAPASAPGKPNVLSAHASGKIS